LRLTRKAIAHLIAGADVVPCPPAGTVPNQRRAGPDQAIDGTGGQPIKS
jgi:hypothetical protein